MPSDAPTSLHARIDEILSLGISPSEIPPDRRRRIQVVTLVMVAMTLIALPVAIGFVAIGAPLLAAAVFLTIAAGFATLVVLWRTRSPRLAGILGTSAVLLFAMVLSLQSGGLSGPGFGGLYLVPMLAALLVDARAGWAFTAVVLVAVVAFWGIEQAGIAVPDVADNHPALALVTRFSTVLAIGVVLTALASRQGSLPDFSVWIAEDDEPTETNERSRHPPASVGPPPLDTMTPFDIDEDTETGDGAYDGDPPTEPNVRHRLRVLALSLPTLSWIRDELADYDLLTTNYAREATSALLAGDVDLVLCSNGAAGEEVHAAIQARAPERAQRVVFVREPMDPGVLRAALRAARSA